VVACAQESPAVSQTALSESQALTYIGLTLDQAKAASRKRRDKFRVNKEHGRDMRATLDFAIGLINAELVDGRPMGFTVEGVGETVKPTRESEVSENCREYFDDSAS
jgi:hypothetical protein